MTAILIGMLFLVANSFAGSYSVAYSGGSVTSTSAGAGPYALAAGVYGGSGHGVGPGSSFSCGGAITATFTWGGGGTAPSSAIVIVTSVASGGESGTGAAAAAANGLGDTVTNTSGMGAVGSGCGTDVGGTGFDMQHYSIQTAGGGSFTVTCTPTASASGPGAGSASVKFTASASALDVTLAGGATDTGTGLQDFLIGQQVTATVSAPSYTVNTYSWSASGCTPFKSYAASTSAGLLTLLGSETSSSLVCYFAGSGSPVISCAVGIGIPNATNIVPSGGVLSGNASRTTTTLLPDRSLESQTIGTVQDTISGGNCTIFLMDSGSGVGASFTMDITTASSPADFDTAGSGTWAFVQTVDVAATKTDGGIGYTFEVPLSPGPGYTVSGLLDHNYPYDTLNHSADGYAHSTVDRPSTNLFTNPSVTQLSLTDSFKMYVMYTPPTPSGTVSMAVPIGYWSWSWGGSASWTGSTWSPSLGTPSMSSFTPTSTHPQWTYNVGNGGWH